MTTQSASNTNKLTAAGLLNDNAAALNKALTGGWMQVKVSLSKWDDRVRDELLADELKASHNVTATRAGDYFKRLLGDASNELAEMNSAMNALRGVLYRVTQKLARDMYVAPLADLPDVINDLENAKRLAEAKIAAFLAVYDQRVLEAQSQLGTMTNAMEYPSVNDVRNRIGVRVEFTPIPDMQTFQGMALPANVTATFAAHVGNQQRELVTTMVTSLYDDLVETTSHLARYFASKASGENNSKLYATRIDQIKRLARQLKAAEGIVNTDFHDLSAAVNELSSVDFDAAKNSVIEAAKAQRLAEGLANKLTTVAKDAPPIIQPITPAAPAAEEVTGRPSMFDGVADVTQTEAPVEAEAEAEAHVEVEAEVEEAEAPVEAVAEVETKKPEVEEDPFASLDSLFY